MEGSRIFCCLFQCGRREPVRWARRVTCAGNAADPEWVARHWACRRTI